MSSVRRCHGLAVLLILVCAGASAASAEAGLIIEGPTGLNGFLTDSGHASVWVSRGCIDAHGAIYFCEGGPGVVLSATEYWKGPALGAIPADLYFLGTPNGFRHDSAAWNATLAPVYPQLPPEIGQKYLGKAWGRTVRVFTFATSAEQDREAIAKLDVLRRNYHFSALRNNCSTFSRDALRLWMGSHLKVRRWIDVGIVTPRGLELGVIHSMGFAPRGQLRVYTFPSPRHGQWRRQPPRSFCEAATMDPKWAAVILVTDPPVYAAFGVCFGTDWLMNRRIDRASARAEGKVRLDAPEEFAAMVQQGEGDAVTVAENAAFVP